MPTIIDSLVVALGLDAKGFKQGQQETSASWKRSQDEARKFASEIEKQGKIAAEAFSKLRNEVIALAAAFMGARTITDFVAVQGQLEASTGRLAVNLGMSTDALSAWEGAAKRAGGSAQGIDNAMRSITKGVEGFRANGVDQNMSWLLRLGVDTNKWYSGATNSGERMLMLADKLSKLRPEQAQFFGQNLGLDEGTIQLLMQGRAAVEALTARQKELNTVTQQDADAAIKRNNAWYDLTDTFQRMGRTLLTDLSPTITALIQDFQQWIEANRPWLEHTIEDAIRDFATWLKSDGKQAWGSFRDAITEVKTTITYLINEVGGAKNAVEILFGLWAISKISPIVANIGLIAGAFTRLGSSINGVIAAWAIYEALRANAAAIHEKSGIQPGDNIDKDSSLSGTSSWLEWTEHAFSQVYNQMTSGYTTDQVPSLGGNNPVYRYSGTGSPPRGIRNNNPGNIEFAGQAGATPEPGSGRFAAFGSMQQGLAALGSLLRSYARRGYDTVRSIISRYAPSGENDTEGYINSVTRALGVSDTQHLDLNNPSVLRQLMSSITTMENGPGWVGMDQIDSALGLGGARIGANSAANSNVSTNIGSITINTKATDAAGIARDLHSELTRYSRVAGQFNYGLA